MTAIQMAGTKLVLVVTHLHMQLVLVIFPLNHHILIDQNLLMLIEVLSLGTLFIIVVLQRPGRATLEALMARLLLLPLGRADLERGRFVNVGVGARPDALVVVVGLAGGGQVAPRRFLIDGAGCCYHRQGKVMGFWLLVAVED